MTQQKRTPQPEANPSKRLNRQSSEPTTDTEPVSLIAGLLNPSHTPGDQTTPATQAALLTNPHLQTAQRQALATHLGRQQGNRYLKNVIAQTNQQPTIPSAKKADVTPIQPNSVAIQRQDGKAAEDEPEVMGILDGTNIATYQDLYGVYQRLVKNLIKAELKLRREGGRVPSIVRRVIKSGNGYKVTLAKVDGQIDEVTYNEGYQWVGEYGDALDKIEDAKIKQAAENFKKASAACQKALASLTSSMDKIRDAQRTAYQAEQTELGAKILDYAFKANDLAAKLTSAKQATHQANTQLANMMGRKTKCPLPVRFMPAFQAVSRIKQALDLYSAASDLLSEGKTGMSKSMKSIKAVTTIADIGNSLIKASGGLTMALTPLQSEILDQTLKALGKLIKVAQRINRELIERGEYDLVNWELEPGGRALFDFMMRVMAAGSPADIPTPVPSAVSDYFVGNQSDIEEMGARGNEMPTSGILFWEKVDNEKIATWLFNHRENLWAIFYGSAKPNSNT